MTSENRDMIKCTKCDVPARALYRDRPKGEPANFVCINCLPLDMIPSDKDQDATLDIQRALR